MNKRFKKLVDSYEEETLKLDTEHALEIIELIVEAFKEVKKIQPLLKHCHFGNGVWDIVGIAKGTDKQDGEITEITDFKDYIKLVKFSVIETPFNESCEDLVELCDYLIDENGLCCSTIVDKINEKGATGLKI